MKKLIIVADWASDTLSCQEVRSAVEGYLKDHNGGVITFIHSTPSTIHTSFLVSQIVETEERYGIPLETVVFQNSDPRLHSDHALKKAEGARPLIIRLKSGIYLNGPNAGFNFSLIKDKIEEVFEYQSTNLQGKFHSRDLYARLAAHLMDEMEDELELEEVSSNIIPSLSGYYVTHIDNFGNIKTLVKLEDFKGKYEFGDMIKIKINNIEKQARFVTNLFGGEPGELVIYPGSSGHKDNPYLEISVWRHFTEENPTTGVHAFNHPKPGMKIEILR
ncbi:SAM-dependent chlorinase/fluorinase [Candidatus Roizmanbacteria bacterium]|nr:SAM-dependent chlorinase/fluorinase [Candidatus Roizmanbacteria bacterium]